MARYSGPVCRLCRREGTKLFLKGTRCETPKCAFERRNTPPGMNDFRRGKMTDYAVHQREKQKVKRYYGLLERQFRKYYRMAERSKGNTGEVLMSLLERRLDNVICRLGFGLSRAQARMLVGHGHVTVNGGRVDVPSYLSRPGDVIKIKDCPKSVQLAQGCLEEVQRDPPEFLARAEGTPPQGHVVRIPEATDVSIPVQTQLIVELCSK
ncbi:MAG: 30S ribosomal protein S4 [Thermoguttaceae bacterium]